MSPRPSIIRVAPATDAISNQTVDQNHPPRRSSFFDDSDFAVPKQEELDQASDAGRITSKLCINVEGKNRAFFIINYFDQQNMNAFYIHLIFSRS